MAQDKTAHVRVARSTWSDLNQLKQQPGDSFDDVIRRLLEQAADSDGGGEA